MFRTTICGSASRPAPYAASSRSIWPHCSAGSPAADVDHVHEHAGALEVREELVAEADAFAGALDQPRHVGNRQLAPIRRVDRPEHRLDRRERVARDLGARVRDPPQERRLARVGQADERSVGKQLQPQLDLALLPMLPDFREPRRLTRRTGEAAVASSACAAACEHDPGARALEVGHELVALEDLRPGRHAKLHALTGRAVLAGAAPGTAPLRLDPASPLEAREIAQIRVRDYDDVAAVPAVTAVRAAFGHVLLAPEAQRAVAAAPGLHPDARAIVEHDA